jgi:flagellar hook-associated protein 1
MSNSGLLLSIAKDALLAQQYGINVTAQNIANADTPGYTKQTPVFTSRTPISYNGLTFGSGVTIEEIIQARDSYLEERLRDQGTNLSGLEEKEKYVMFLEEIFNEDSEYSLSAQLNDFWNAWQDLSNNPSGELERTMVYETSSLLADNFTYLKENLHRVESHLNLSIEEGVHQVNQLITQLASLNSEIINLEATSPANDLKDQRNVILEELSSYLDIKCYEASDGNLSVLTKGGHVLVDKGNTSSILFEDGDIKWDSGDTTKAVITSSINGGKIGAWLQLRDENIATYKDNLDELAESLIFEVNKIHANGAGKDTFTGEVQGTYEINDSSSGVNSSGLNFQDNIIDGSFKIWVYDEDGNVADTTTISIDADVTKIDDIVSDISGLANINAEVISDGYLKISASAGCTFAFSDETSNILAALGINTFFSGTSADNIAVNPNLAENKAYIAAARVDPIDGSIAAGDNSNACAIADLQYEEISFSETSTTFEHYCHSLVGLIGIHSKNIQDQRGSSEIVVSQLTEMRDNSSSVSLDEEMTNLIKFQHAYAAAAKLITTADEMLEALLAVR